MTLSVERMIAGIVETLRDDVIPHVGDAYGRGQALGIIDLLNNFGARLDWDTALIAREVDAKRRALVEAEALATGSDIPPDPAQSDSTQPTSAQDVITSASLLVQAADLDRAISERLLKWMAEGGADAAVARLRQHMHDELREEMKMVHRPSFAEISTGGTNDKGVSG